MENNDRNREFWPIDELPAHELSAEIYELFRFFLICCNIQRTVLRRQDMSYFAIRLITFFRFPRSAQQITIDIANAGFYYFGDSDTVVCYCCGLVRRNWLVTDDPFDIHSRFASTCIFLMRNGDVNITNYNRQGCLRNAREIEAFIRILTYMGQIHGVRLRTYESSEMTPMAHLSNEGSDAWYRVLGIQRRLSVSENQEIDTADLPSLELHSNPTRMLFLPEPNILSIQRRHFQQGDTIMDIEEYSSNSEIGILVQNTSISVRPLLNNERCLETCLQAANSIQEHSNDNNIHELSVSACRSVNMVSSFRVPTDETERKTLLNDWRHQSTCINGVQESNNEEVEMTPRQRNRTMIKNQDMAEESNSVTSDYENNDDNHNKTNISKERRCPKVNHQDRFQSESINKENSSDKVEPSFVSHSIEASGSMTLRRSHITNDILPESESNKDGQTGKGTVSGNPDDGRDAVNVSSQTTEEEQSKEECLPPETPDIALPRDKHSKGLKEYHCGNTMANDQHPTNRQNASKCVSEFSSRLVDRNARCTKSDEVFMETKTCNKANEAEKSKNTGPTPVPDDKVSRCFKQGRKISMDATESEKYAKPENMPFNDSTAKCKKSTSTATTVQDVNRAERNRSELKDILPESESNKDGQTGKGTVSGNPDDGRDAVNVSSQTTEGEQSKEECLPPETPDIALPRDKHSKGLKENHCGNTMANGQHPTNRQNASKCVSEFSSRLVDGNARCTKPDEVFMEIKTCYKANEAKKSKNTGPSPVPDDEVSRCFRQGRKISMDAKESEEYAKPENMPFNDSTAKCKSSSTATTVQDVNRAERNRSELKGQNLAETTQRTGKGPSPVAPDDKSCSKIHKRPPDILPESESNKDGQTGKGTVSGNPDDGRDAVNVSSQTTEGEQSKEECLPPETPDIALPRDKHSKGLKEYHCGNTMANDQHPTNRQNASKCVSEFSSRLVDRNARCTKSDEVFMETKTCNKANEAEKSKNTGPTPVPDDKVSRCFKQDILPESESNKDGQTGKGTVSGNPDDGRDAVNVSSQTTEEEQSKEECLPPETPDIALPRDKHSKGLKVLMPESENSKDGQRRKETVTVIPDDGRKAANVSSQNTEKGQSKEKCLPPKATDLTVSVMAKDQHSSEYHCGNTMENDQHPTNRQNASNRVSEFSSRLVDGNARCTKSDEGFMETKTCNKANEEEKSKNTGPTPVPDDEVSRCFKQEPGSKISMDATESEGYAKPENMPFNDSTAKCKKSTNNTDTTVQDVNRAERNRSELKGQNLADTTQRTERGPSPVAPDDKSCSKLHKRPSGKAN